MQYFKKGGRVKKNKTNTTNHNVNKNNITIHNNISTSENQEKERIDKGSRLFGPRMNGAQGQMTKIETDKEHKQPIFVIKPNEPLRDQPINIEKPNIGIGSIDDILNPVEKESKEEDEEPEELPEAVYLHQSPDEIRKDKVYSYFESLGSNDDFFKTTKKGRVSANLDNMCLHFNFDRPSISRRQIYIRLEQSIDALGQNEY